MKNLTKAVIAVMKEVRGMEKNSRVGQGGHAYNGTKDQDVKEVFNEALAKHGLIMFPKDIEEHTQVDRWEQDYNGNKTQKQSVFTKVKVYYTLAHESGEEVTICGYGHGVDPQDKGAGKATTYAMKNALLYTFLTPVGKIDDTETTHSNEMPTPKPTVAKSATVPKAERVIVAEGDENFLKIVKGVSTGKATLQQALDKFNISEDVEASLKEKIQSLAEIV
jgi:hypothetical protein